MSSLLACPECDLLQREVALARGGRAHCRRCGMVLYRDVADGLNRTLAFSLAAAVLFVMANVFPIVGLEAQGQRVATTLLGTVHALYDQGMTSVALLVFTTTMLIPALEIGAMLQLLLPIKMGPRTRRAMFRLIQTVRPWGMVEVFLLGTLVALVKLADLGSLVPGVALWSLGALTLLLAAAQASFDPRSFWARVQEEVPLKLPAEAPGELPEGVQTEAAQ